MGGAVSEEGAHQMRLLTQEEFKALFQPGHAPVQKEKAYAESNLIRCCVCGGEAGKAEFSLQTDDAEKTKWFFCGVCKQKAAV
jgi:hypothetical protein